MGPGEFFAHGGSGYALSHNAVQEMAKAYHADQLRWDTMALEGEFGEVPLARLLVELDIYLTWALPHFQGGNAAHMDFAWMEHGRLVWCYPAVTYHHVDERTIRDLSNFEARWFRTSVSKQYFRHSDVFKQWILPQIVRGERQDWDNFSEDLIGGVRSLAECEEMCRNRLGCVQYSFSHSESRIDYAARMGRSKTDISSGWLKDRVHGMTDVLDARCDRGFLI
jgi:hypothetical protein